MTFVNMQTEVGDLLNTTVSASTIPDLTQVKRDLNTARDLVFNRLLSLGQDYNVRLAKADLVASQELYGLPSDLRKIVRVELGYSTSTDRYKADRMDTNAENDPVNTSYLEGDPKYAVRGDNIELNPTPSSAVTDGLWLWYIEDPTDMSADADTSGVPIDYDHLLPLYAAAKGSYTVGKHQEGNNYIALFRTGLDDMEQEVIQRNIDDGDMIIIRDEYGGL
jgi:hypothetical protein